MNSPKPKPAFLRYSLARLKSLARFQVWMPVGAIALLGLGVWQYWVHPEWSGQPPAATTSSEDIPANLLEDPIEGFGLEVPASSLEPVPGTEGTDQNANQNAAAPLPSPLDLNNPLLTSNLFEQSQPPILAPNDLSTPLAQPQNTSQQQPSPQPSPQLPQLPQLFKPLLPGFKNPQQLIPTSPAAPQATQPAFEGVSQPKSVVVTENPLLRALERQSNQVDAGTQPPVAPNYTPNYVPNYAPNYAPNYGSQPAPAQPVAPGYQAPYYPYPSSNYGYNYGSQPAPSQPTAPNSPYQQPYGNPNVGYGNQPVPQPPGQPIQPRYNTNTPPGW